MITVSLCMIVKDEEDTLERCLGSAKNIADEIIIVDTGSADRTKQIAARFTDKIFDFEWTRDFSAARNFSYAQATMDYILWLDADDIVLPGDAVKFKKLKKTLPPETDVVMMKYNTGFDRQGGATFSYFRERLSKRSRNFKWREPVHEYLETGGARVNSDICVTHAKPPGRPGGRNIAIYESLINAGGELSPRGMYYYARELMDHERYNDAVKWFGRFLDSEKGWLEDNISACRELAKCYLAISMPAKALRSMLRSFGYDAPRAETCCQLGYYFKEQGNHSQAVFWFKLALDLESDGNVWGFRQEDCRGYIPCVELAVCYDALGEYRKAAGFNELASRYKPDSPAVLGNRKYFESKLAEIT